MELLKEVAVYLKHTVLSVTDNLKQPDTFDIASVVNLEQLAELVAKLETYLLEWEKIHDGLDLDRIGNFSEQMQLLGEEYQFPKLSNYSKSLSQAISTFNIEQVEKILTQFPELVTWLKSKVQ